MAELVLKTVADAAAALDHATSMIRAGEVAQCLAIAALCDLHHVDETVLVEGCERWVPGGADGTPLIGEFVTAHISTLLGVSISGAFGWINRVLNLRHRHPTLWRLVIEGDIRPFEGFRVADAAVAVNLDAAACERFDRMCRRPAPATVGASEVPGREMAPGRRPRASPRERRSRRPPT